MAFPLRSRTENASIFSGPWPDRPWASPPCATDNFPSCLRREAPPSDFVNLLHCNVGAQGWNSENWHDIEPLYFREGEIWWAHFGVNIGYEIDDKKANFARPVIVLHKYPRRGGKLEISLAA